MRIQENQVVGDSYIDIKDYKVIIASKIWLKSTPGVSVSAIQLF
jgi:hypothetical protein